MGNEISEYTTWLEAVCIEIYWRFGARTSQKQLEEALSDEPSDMFMDNASPKEYVDLAHGEYGDDFWVPVEL